MLDEGLDLCLLLFKDPSLGGNAGILSPTACSLSLEDRRLPAGFGGNNGG